MHPGTLRQVVVACAVAAVSVLPAALPAHAAGEPPIPSTLATEQETHFYYLGFERIPVPSGSPYLTAVSPTTLVTLDWDFEVSRVDIATKEAAALGSLPLPPGARVLDLVADGPVRGSTAPVMVAYSLKEPDGCRRSTLREATIDLATGANALGRVWFQSPCYPQQAGSSVYGDGLNQSGGRVVRVPPSMQSGKASRQYFLSVGDFELVHQGIEKVPAPARRLLATIQLVTAPGKHRTYARGLRNVQGMTIASIDGTPRLVVTEHGPRGGDDVSLVTEGADFGWPRYSYGTSYGNGTPSSQPSHEGKGTGKGVSPPLWSFIPSIGPTSIVQVSGPAFREWWGSKSRTPDLVLNGMRAQLLVRLRLDDGAVRSTEGIRTGLRMRTLVQLPSGLLVGGADFPSSELVLIRPTRSWSTSAGTFVPAG